MIISNKLKDIELKRLRIQGKLYLSQYLKELEALTIIDKSSLEERLLSIETTSSLPQINRAVFHKKQIRFDEKQRLRELFTKLANCKDGHAFLLTDYSKFCGALKLNTILEFDVNFLFGDEHQGMVVISLEDNSNELLLDFFEEGSERKMEVEIFGEDWPSVQI